jgi:hypothetical protein
MVIYLHVHVFDLLGMISSIMIIGLIILDLWGIYEICIFCYFAVQLD